jgi:hypothetical protein
MAGRIKVGCWLAFDAEQEMPFRATAARHPLTACVVLAVARRGAWRLHALEVQRVLRLRRCFNCTGAPST